MIIKNIPELLKMLNYYKNPYIICRYKGIDWSLYEKYNNYSPNIFSFSNELKIISCRKNQEYKIKKKDFLYILNGSIIINEYKKVDTMFYFNNYDNYDNEKNYKICKGFELNNCFLHYRNYKNDI
jgi:hypothetical protein